MDNSKNENTESLYDLNELKAIPQTIKISEGDCIAVPVEELVELLKKQVELDLIYAASAKFGDACRVGTLVSDLYGLRYGTETETEGDDA